MFGYKHVWGYLYPYQEGIKAKALKRHSYTIGKDSSCDLVLTRLQVPNEEDYLNLGKAHFKIKKKDDGVFLEDLSRNHTAVNTKTMTVGERVKLCHNDVISVLRPQLRVYVYLENSMIDKTDFPDVVKQKYIVSRNLGEGGFGEVYLVFQKENCKRFAIKKLWKTDENSKSLNTEITILRKLNHPCLIHMHEVLDTADHVFIVLEHMDGGHLLSRIFPKKRLTDQEAKFIFYQLAVAIQYLHDNQIAHRDIKPENILLASDEPYTLMKVTDFGLSKVEADTSLMTSVGTPVFAAPEIVVNIDDPKIYTKQVDIWSMGVVLYYCISGTTPFHYHGPLTVWECQYLPSVWSQRSIIKDLVKRMLVVEEEKRISIEGILAHPWLKDEVMRSRAHELMYPGEEYRPSVEVEPVSPKEAFLQEEVKLRTENNNRFSFGVRVLPPGPINRKSVPAQMENIHANTESINVFNRAASQRKSTSPLEKKSPAAPFNKEQSLIKTWSLRFLNGAPKPPPKPLNIQANGSSVNNVLVEETAQEGLKSPAKPPRTFQYSSDEPSSPKVLATPETIPEENSHSRETRITHNSQVKHVTYTKQNTVPQNLMKPFPTPRTSIETNRKSSNCKNKGSIEDFNNLTLDEQKRLHEQSLVGVPIPPNKPVRNTVASEKRPSASNKSGANGEPTAAQTFVKLKRQAPKPPVKPKMEYLGRV